MRPSSLLIAGITISAVSALGSNIVFQLKGETGQEEVTISIGGNENMKLTTNWQTFSYPRPSSGSFYVEFHNDNGPRDVYIRGHESQVTDLLPGTSFKKLSVGKGWKCGTSNENERCEILRQGQLAWSGKYTYTLKGCPENNIDYYGNDLKVLGNVPDWQSCARKCMEESRCSYWSWISTDYEHSHGHLKCYLKNAGSGRKILHGIISGDSTCQAPSVPYGNSDEKLATNVHLKYFNRLNHNHGLSWDQGGQTISFNGSHIYIEDSNTFIPDIKTVFITHGLGGSSAFPRYCENWVKNYLTSDQDVQVICIDWNPLAELSIEEITTQGGLLIGEAKNSIDVGWWLGRLLQSLVTKTDLNVERVKLIGHSLGAHAVGMMGRTFTALSSSNQQVARVTGLDPAGPLFVQDKYGLKKHMIGRDSGTFVDIIHTNGNFNPSIFSFYYGVLHALGHADFYVNGGMTQSATGCNPTTSIHDTNCDHNRCLEYYLNSILGGPAEFPAYPCVSAKTCSEKRKSSNTIVNHMGEYATKPTGGLQRHYYIEIATDMGPTNSWQ